MFKKNSSGIHFQLNDKELTQNKPIQNAKIPDEVIIPLTQHKGLPAELCVQLGNKVHEGDIIGKSAEGISAYVHASISGTITEIKEIINFNGKKSQAVVIKKEKSTAPTSYLENADWMNETAEQILEKIKRAGIVGLGGATFPTHIKLQAALTNNLHTLIVNAAECEPYITCDYRNLMENFNQLLNAILIMGGICELYEIFIGIESQNKELITSIQHEIQKHSVNIKVVALKPEYPQGDEKIIIKSCTGKIVPYDKLPADIGILVMNVSTLLAISDMVSFSKPLIERVVTVSGPAIKNPGNYRVKIGTPISTLLEECGGLTDNAQQILVGGLMMGFAQDNLKVPVTKGTLGVLALTDVVLETEEKKLKCIRCARCINACPFGIQPQLLYDLIIKKKLIKAKKAFIFGCKECGCSDYVCPAKIPLVKYFRYGKAEILKNNI